MIGTRLYKLIFSGIAPVNVLNLGIAKCGFYVVLELLARSCVWTQNIAPAGDRQTLATRHASIARSSPKPRPVMCADLAAVTARIGLDHTLVVLLAIVVSYNSIRALLLQIKDLILKIVRVKWCTPLLALQLILASEIIYL